MTRLLRISVVAILVAVCFGLYTQPAPAADGPAGKVFELRIYFASPGKLDALNARFRDHTLSLFKKHGVEVVGFWVPAPADPESKVAPAYPPETLLYLVSFPSVEAQKKAWAAFKTDPEWIKVKADSEKDGIRLAAKVISQNFTATDYSPIK
jgi:hypothetical protein